MTAPCLGVGLIRKVSAKLKGSVEGFERRYKVNREQMHQNIKKSQKQMSDALKKETKKKDPFGLKAKAKAVKKHLDKVKAERAKVGGVKSGAPAAAFSFKPVDLGFAKPEKPKPPKPKKRKIVINIYG